MKAKTEYPTISGARLAKKDTAGFDAALLNLGIKLIPMTNKYAGKNQKNRQL